MYTYMHMYIHPCTRTPCMQRTRIHVSMHHEYMYPHTHTIHRCSDMVSVVLVVCISVSTSTYSIPLWMVGIEIASIVLCVSMICILQSVSTASCNIVLLLVVVYSILEYFSIAYVHMGMRTCVHHTLCVYTYICIS